MHKSFTAISDLCMISVIEIAFLGLRQPKWRTRRTAITLFPRIARITSIYNYVLIRVIRGDSGYGYSSLWTSKHGQALCGFRS